MLMVEQKRGLGLFVEKAVFTVDVLGSDRRWW